MYMYLFVEWSWQMSVKVDQESNDQKNFGLIDVSIRNRNEWQLWPFMTDLQFYLLHSWQIGDAIYNYPVWPELESGPS